MHPIYNLTAVGLRSDFPYVNLNSRCIRIDCPYPGAEVEFLQMVLRLSNATATLIPREMSTDEMINMLGNGTADITIFSLIQKPERMKKVEFTMPIGYIYTGYFIKEVGRMEVMDYILTSFRLPALTLLILTSLSVATLLYCYSRIFNSTNLSLTRFMMATFKPLLKQFQLNVNGPTCVRILACAWLWFCFTVIVHYEAKLRSVFTLTRICGTLFTDLDGAMDAIEGHGWKMIIQKGGYSPFWYCNPDQCARLRRLQSRDLVQESTDDVMTVLSHDRQFVFSALTDDLAPYPMSIIDDRRRLLFVRDEFMTPQLLAYAIRKGMPTVLRRKLNSAIALTRPSFATIRGRYQKPYERVLLEVSSKAYLAAFVIFISELLYFRYGHILQRYVHIGREKINIFISPEVHQIGESFDLASLNNKHKDKEIIEKQTRNEIRKTVSSINLQKFDSSHVDFRKPRSCPF
ncbi:hypothetical protein RB195_020391 [Necator americanus]|uniref:Solute-binding protein family 3/N-terminal domain-containing protein n=1 Tax=Necator americanus TaxID=51031 RepID=A0ABR1CIL7_NECAM